MSSSRDAKNEQQLQRRIETFNANGYGHLDGELVYALAVNNPAGFGDMSTTAPGTVLTAQQVGQAFTRFKQGFYVDGAQEKSFADYLADPRAAIAIENDQFVYRPERMQGDFVSEDRETLMESLGAFPFVLSAFAAPFAASLGAAAAASGAGAAGGAVDMGVGLGGNLGAWGGITPLAEGATLTAASGSGLISTLKPAAQVASTVGSIASATGAVANATGSVASASRLLNATQGATPVGASLPTASNPLILNIGATDMAGKTAAPAAATPSLLGGMSTQTLVLIAVAIVAVLALSQTTKKAEG